MNNELRKLMFTRDFLYEFKDSDKDLHFYVKELTKKIKILQRNFKLKNIINEK
jgi:hypothetical protein